MSLKQYIKKKFLKQSIFRYYRNLSPEEQTPELARVIGYLKKHRIFVFPYDFVHKYKPGDIPVTKDGEKGLFYTIYHGKRLYYKDGHNKKQARRYFNSLYMEQDPESPHRYLSDDFNVDKDDIVVDIGAAEGNFSIDIIDKVKKIYLFEADPLWLKALEATFEAWKDKVEIIPKMVSDKSNGQTVALDQYFRDRKPFDFIKIDVDGAEKEVLAGMEHLLENKKIKKIALCTYHRQEDAAIFSAVLKNYGYDIGFSKGYMIFRKRIEKPYLRKGVLKAILHD